MESFTQLLFDENYEFTAADLTPPNDQSIQLEFSNSTEVSEETAVPKRSRKRTVKAANWQRNVQQKNRQTGLSYQDRRGVSHAARKIQYQRSCLSDCKFRCSVSINDEQREAVFQSFWSMNANQKRDYLLRTTERNQSVRRQHKERKGTEKRNYSFRYFIPIQDKSNRVCKRFYLSTIDVSQKRIYSAHKAKNPVTGTLPLLNSGDIVSIRTNSEDANFLRQHIDSFPRVPAHYCRANSKKEYLETGLSVAKMYDLYVSSCREAMRMPLSIWKYRSTFNLEFNLEFRVPKKDQCSTCAAYSNIQSPSEEQRLAEAAHSADKDQTRLQKSTDKATLTNDVCLLCFDLENVFQLPKSNINTFFYKRKLSVFNLTAVDIGSKKSYCALWTEKLCGRAGENIACALLRILNEIVETNPQYSTIIIWSDSCVPQNRNSIMSYAIMSFLRTHPSVKKVVQKFCTPGHSSVQEVDALHSVIERGLDHEIMSPVKLFRNLLNLRSRNPIRVIQLTASDFVDLKSKSKVYLRGEAVPYTKIKWIEYESANCTVKYGTSFSVDCVPVVVSIFRAEHVNKARRATIGTFDYPACDYSLPGTLTKEKQADLKSCYAHFDATDKAYWNAILR